MLPGLRYVLDISYCSIYLVSFSSSPSPSDSWIYLFIHPELLCIYLYLVSVKITERGLCVICKSTCPETTSPWWRHLQNIQACLPWQPPFSQHVLWWYCNHPDILSSIVEILLFNSVFHDGVTPISVSILKPPLGVIGVLPLKPQVSPILSICI